MIKNTILNADIFSACNFVKSLKIAKGDMDFKLRCKISYLIYLLCCENFILMAV